MMLTMLMMMMTMTLVIAAERRAEPIVATVPGRRRVPRGWLAGCGGEMGGLLCLTARAACGGEVM